MSAAAAAAAAVTASPDANEPVSPPPLDVDAVGREFARVYFDAFVATKTDAPALESLHDDRSKYVFLRPGRLDDHMVKGARAIGRFVERTHHRPVGCAVRVDSVDALQVRPGWLAVLTVGELSRPARGDGGEPRTFVQSTVVKCAGPSPSAGCRGFSVVGTVFKFDDRVVDDVPGDAADGDGSMVSAGGDGTAVLAGGDGTTVSADGVGTTVSAGPEAQATDRVFVGGLSQTVTEDDLSASFGHFGPVADVHVYRYAADKKKGGGASAGQPPRYFGIVRFEDPATANAVARRGTVSLANGDRATVAMSVRRQMRGKTTDSSSA